MDWLTFVVVDPVKAMLFKILSYIPAIAGAIVILVVGWLLAKMAKMVVVRVLKAIQLDALSDKGGVTNILAHGEIKMTLSELIGAIIYWLLVLVVIATALNALNLSVAAELVSTLVNYVPNILAAVFILVLGSLLANFVSTIVRTSAGNAGIKRAKLLGHVTQTVVIIFSIIMAIEQLKIATTLIVLAVNVLLISVGLGIAIAFGLGCKDIAGKYVQNLVDNLKK